MRAVPERLPGNSECAPLHALLRVVLDPRDAILEISNRSATLPDLDTRPADDILGYDECGGFR